MIGRFVFRPDVHEVVEELDAAEVSIADVVGGLAARGTLVAVSYRGAYHDIGSMPGYLRACAAYAAADLTRTRDEDERGVLGSAKETVLDQDRAGVPDMSAASAARS